MQKSNKHKNKTKQTDAVVSERPLKLNRRGKKTKYSNFREIELKFMFKDKVCNTILSAGEMEPQVSHHQYSPQHQQKETESHYKHATTISHITVTMFNSMLLSLFMCVEIVFLILIGHAAELPFVFHTYEDKYTDEEEKLADIVSTYWGNFVNTGDPNIPRKHKDTCDAEGCVVSACMQITNYSMYTGNNNCCYFCLVVTLG